MSDSRDASGAGRHRSLRAAAAWTIGVVAASLIDPAVVLGRGAAGDGTSGAFAAAHLLAYGVLAWLLVGATDPERRSTRGVVVAVAVATTIGVGVELLQAPVVARTASAADAAVNAVGAGVGAGVRAAMRRR